MEKHIVAEIRRFILENPENRFPGEGGPFFGEPLIGFAAAGDPLFPAYKRIIGDFHLTPEEIVPGAASVIVWSLPIVRSTRESNRQEERWPSRAWALTRTHGEGLNAALRRHLETWLDEKGYRWVAPQLSPLWEEYADTPVGVASRWSERHVAYAAGLGTFSLNDALITPRGIAHRLGSVVTDLPLRPTPRTAPDPRHNCLWFREGTCGLCIGRCPIGALSPEGHDKSACRAYVYGAAPREVADLYGVPQTGCGLCQTKVPCEAGIPPGKTR